MASGREKVISILDASATVPIRPLFGLKNEQLDRLISELAAPAYRSRQLAQGLYRDWATTLDDITTLPKSLRDQLAQEMGLPSIVRHVFLDDDESLEAVRHKLAETEAVARRQGFVVAIGHPHEATLQALGEWLPGLQAKGLVLAPASAVLRKRNGWD